MNIQVVDIPNAGIWGKFAGVLDRIELLPAEKCLRLDHVFTESEIETIRSSAKRRGYKLRIRRTADATFLWKKEAKQ